MISTLSRPALRPQDGPFEDLKRDDDGRGYERDETDQFHQLVRRLVLDGDRRAALAGRRARRTLGEMLGGDDACPVCGYWRCRCGG